MLAPFRTVRANAACPVASKAMAASLVPGPPWPGRRRAGIVELGHRGEQVEHRPDLEALLSAVPERAFRVHGVAGPPADPGASDVPGGLQVGHDRLHAA